MLLARLATDLAWQGKGVGLLRDAMQRTVQVADIAGLRAFFVHTKDGKAKAFYEHFNFFPSPTDPYHLFLLVKDIMIIMGGEVGLHRRDSHLIFNRVLLLPDVVPNYTDGRTPQQWLVDVRKMPARQ